MQAGRRLALRRLAAWPGLGVAAASLAAPAVLAATPPARPWPAWEAFVQAFIGSGGRVAESGDSRQRTVSEAQGYALFFALVANQAERFERLLRWTEDNLCGGDLTQRLPAWWWGRRDDGTYGVLDDNPASDADLWIAQSLGEAGRLWGVRRYTVLAALLAERVRREEVAELPGLGPMLLPGPRGFVLGPGRWRLNPSYLAPMQLRWLANRLGPPWQALHDASLRLLRDSAPRGHAPDWTVYDAALQRFEPWQQGLGSYNAIRVYLWLGLSAVPPALLAHFAPMAAAAEAAGATPEKVDAVDGARAGDGPPGFSAALLPFLQASGRQEAMRRLRQRVQAQPPQPDAYYDQVLRLFGEGAIDGRYRFDAAGNLVPEWAR